MPFDILGRLHSLSLYRERRGRIFNLESHVSSSSGGNMTTPNTRPSNMVMASEILLSIWGLVSKTWHSRDLTMGEGQSIDSYEYTFNFFFKLSFKPVLHLQHISGLKFSQLLVPNISSSQALARVPTKIIVTYYFLSYSSSIREETMYDLMKESLLIVKKIKLQR